MVAAAATVPAPAAAVTAVSNRRGCAALTAVAILTSLILAIGMGLAGRVAGLRPASRVVRSARLVELAAQSALEEVCARLEDHQLEDGAVDPTSARRCYAPEELSFLPARVTFSDTREAAGRGPRYGIAEIVLQIGAPAGRQRVMHTVVTRRYFDMLRIKGRDSLRVRPDNIFQVVDRS